MLPLKALVLYVLSLTVSGEYFYVPLKMTYMKALTACSENGLQLVDVKTNETQGLVSAYMKYRNNDIWNGLHYNASLSKFQWGDGEIVHSPGSLPWQDGQPVGSQETDCVVMNLNGGSFMYRMATCHLNITFLCLGEAGYPELVFERRGISGQLLSSALVHDVEDCALSCMDDESCIYFIYIYRAPFRGLCLIHIQIPS